MRWAIARVVMIAVAIAVVALPWTASAHPPKPMGLTQPLRAGCQRSDLGIGQPSGADCAATVSETKSSAGSKAAPTTGTFGPGNAEAGSATLVSPGIALGRHDMAAHPLDQNDRPMALRGALAAADRVAFDLLLVAFEQRGELAGMRQKDGWR